MKRYSLLGFIIAAMTCSSLLAQEKTALQPNATVLGLLQGSVGKGVELHLRSGEKLGGKVAQVTDSIVHLSNLTGAEYFDAFVDAKDISAVVVRVARQITSPHHIERTDLRHPKRRRRESRLTEDVQDCQTDAELPILAA